MSWKISTLEKKNVVENEMFTKDGKTVTHSTGFRWGYVIVEEDPEIENPADSDSVIVSDYSIEDCGYDDGCWEEWDFGDLSEDEIELFMQMWEDGWYDSLSTIGWDHTDTEVVFIGPLEVTNLGDSDDEPVEEEQPVATSKKWPF